MEVRVLFWAHWEDAAVAELVYAPVLGTGSRKGLRVRVSPAARQKFKMKKVIIEKNGSDCRIDKFLKKEVFFNDEKITRGEIIRLIKSGKILVNDKKVKPSYILKEKDVIIVGRITHNTKLVPNKNLKIEIIHQDENIIVVNKPAGISVHPVKPDENETLVNWLIYKFPEVENVGEDFLRPGIVHRLDKDTSGIMVVARNQKSFEELKNLFKTRKIEKKYLALVYGRLKDKRGVIDKPIARSSNYKKQVIAGKKTKTKVRLAVTEYRAIKRHNDYSLVEVSPKTGRMHQIRVHMNSIGYPVVGDKIYGSKKVKSKISVPRQLLHAKSIKFELFGKNYFFKTKLPQDFETFLNRVDETLIKR